MKYYILVGSNNFWYEYQSNLKQLKTEAKKILSGRTKIIYSDPETYRQPEIPESLYIFEAKEINHFT